jgi:iron complex outermembrane recepter protein
MKSIIFGVAGSVLVSMPLAAQDVPHSIDEVTVLSVPWEARSDGLTQSISVLEGTMLESRLEGTIGETLSSLPGMASSFFGPGASRPIIRGQSGDRVRILIGGIGAIDASSVSPDHAVAGESLSIERVEVIRGASTLLFGPNAVGGVINILDGRIPASMPEGGFDGAARVQYGTGAQERAVAASVTAAASENIAIHVDGFKRKARDYRVPSAAQRDGEKLVANSDVESWAGNAGVSWIGEQGFLGVAIALNGSNYGIVGEDGEEEGEAVRIDLAQTRFDLMGGIDTDFLIFQQIKLRFGWADYEHTELEGEDIGTTFANKGWEGRIDLVQQARGAWSGGVGLQVKRRNFAAIGDEAFTPPSATEQWGVFLAEEVSIGDVLVQGGLRYDQTRVRTKTPAEARNFNQVSMAVGAIWSVTELLDLSVNLSRTERAPTAEELYSDGAHLATQTFELGNPMLGEETAWAAELGVRVGANRFHLEAYAYFTRYEDYIYQADTGLFEDGLPVRLYTGADANFSGFEVEASYDVSDTLSVRAQVDMVRAKLQDIGENLPRIPPKSFTGGIDYGASQWDVGAEVTVVDKQDKIAGYEEPTPGHTFVNVYLTWRPLANYPDVSLNIRAKNLFNAAGFNHVSFIKREAPLPGRNVRFSVSLRF